MVFPDFTLVCVVDWRGAWVVPALQLMIIRFCFLLFCSSSNTVTQ